MTYAKGAVAGTAALVLLASQLARAQEFPAGPNSELVATACTGCHVASQVTIQRRDAKQWADTVNLMVNLGLVLSDADQRIVVDYLSEHFGPETPASAPGG